MVTSVTKSNHKNGGTKNQLFDDTPRINFVSARFEGSRDSTFSDLVKGYKSLKVLTYSSSVSMVKQIASLVDDLEIIFGREDIINRMTQYITYQDLLIKELKQEFKDDDIICQRIDTGKIRLFVVKGIISHEKMYLLDGDIGKRIITGSANFSERAVSGTQNESFVCFDNDALAWDYFNEKYESIRNQSSMSIAKHAILDPNFDIEQMPVFDPQVHQSNTILVIDERPLQPNIIHKMINVKVPKQYEGLSQIISSDRGLARLDRQVRNRAVQYVRSNTRTQDENPEELLSIHLQTGEVILSGRKLDLVPNDDEIRRDVNLMLEYFEGYKQFRGNTSKLARDYFTFMSWLYISPFMCDFRNRSEARIEDELDKLDYPIFGLLYGKSNCGKSELIRWLLLSMFQREGFLPNTMFTKSQIGALRSQNLRYPMAFDDIDKIRFGDHAMPLIKEDFIGLPDYPGMVLSMNADKDAFESEVRKRCLILYTGASLPDNSEARKLGTKLKRLKKQLGNAFYRRYLSKVFENLDSKPPKDVLKFSSQILCDLFAEYSDTQLPAWCQPTTMERYLDTKHDKVKDELRSHLQHSPDAWQLSIPNVVFSLNDGNQVRKLQKDVPDHIIAHVSGTKLIFILEELEEFLGEPILAKRRRKWWHLGK